MPGLLLKTGRRVRFYSQPKPFSRRGAGARAECEGPSLSCAHVPLQSGSALPRGTCSTRGPGRATCSVQNADSTPRGWCLWQSNAGLSAQLHEQGPVHPTRVQHILTIIPFPSTAAFHGSYLAPSHPAPAHREAPLVGEERVAHTRASACAGRTPPRQPSRARLGRFCSQLGMERNKPMEPRLGL